VDLNTTTYCAIVHQIENPLKHNTLEIIFSVSLLWFVGMNIEPQGHKRVCNDRGEEFSGAEKFSDIFLAQRS